MKPVTAAAALGLLLGWGGRAGAQFDIVIAPGPALAGNGLALAAVNRAAAAWEARISDPITITIDADFAALGGSTLALGGSVNLQASYNTVRNQLVADAANEADDAVVGFLPTAAQFSAILPAGRSWSGNVLGTKANLKAMGFAGLDGVFGASDGTVTFNSSMTFDFDSSDGVTAGTVDLQTLAAHYIGQVLGFASAVDAVNGGATSVSPMVLDLFRFTDNVAGQDPATNAEFTFFPRNLTPGASVVTDDLAHEYAMSTGTANAGFPGTDGHEAGNWKADELSGTTLGVMDPTLATGVAYGPSEADFRALDLIGYEVAPVPEPTVALLLFGGGGVLLRRRLLRTRDRG